jgi:hypothetical protein
MGPPGGGWTPLFACLRAAPTDRTELPDRSVGGAVGRALKLEMPMERAYPGSRTCCIPGQAQSGPPWGQWTRYRSTSSTPSRRRLCWASATGSLRRGLNLVVINTWSRGRPLLRRALERLIVPELAGGVLEVACVRRARPRIAPPRRDADRQKQQGAGLARVRRIRAGIGAVSSRPEPRSTNTSSGPLTNTSVTPGSRRRYILGVAATVVAGWTRSSEGRA